MSFLFAIVFSHLHNYFQLNVRLKRGVTLAPWEIQGKHVRLGDLMGGPGPVEVHKCVIKMDGIEKMAAGTLVIFLNATV